MKNEIIEPLAGKEVNRAFTAKKRFLFLTVALLCAVMSVQANDYLEVQRHYQVYSNGRNSIHFKIPVWAYGRINDYHLDSAFTTIRWQVKGQSVEP
ncbi:MAG: hypothetical protein VZR54_10770, partial [Ruminococcus sp.]|nr:hypothetical protein [Ruminococcus sp.]